MSGILKTLNNITYSKEKVDEGRLKLTIEVANERFELAKDRIYERLAPSVKVDGFRPGKAPKNVIVAKLGPTLFEQTLNDIVPKCTLEIIKKEKLMPLDQITYKVEKIAEGSGVKYSATFSVFPEFELPDISKIKVEKKKTEVKDEEIETVIKQMANEKKEDKEMPKIDDKWVASLNLGVKNLKELKDKIKGELLRQKENAEKNRYVGEIIKKISKNCNFNVPSVLIEKQIIKKEAEYKQRIKDLGMKVEDFLRNQKTSMKELKKGWREEIKEGVRSEIIFYKIADKYKIKVKDEEVDKQVDQIKDEKLKEQYKSPQSKSYLRNMLFRQKIIDKVLELVGEKKDKN